MSDKSWVPYVEFHGMTRPEVVRAKYRKYSRQGQPKAWLLREFNDEEIHWVDAHVDQMFWQMVRHELRTNPEFQSRLEFISDHYKVPQHEFLERIKKRHWAQMQVWTDDRQHRAFLTEVFRAWRAAKVAAREADPAYDEERRRKMLYEQDAARYAARSWADRLAAEWYVPSDLEMVQWLQDLGE